MLILLTLGDAEAKQKTFWKKSFDVLPSTLSVFGLTSAGALISALKGITEADGNDFEIEVFDAFASQKSLLEESNKQIINTIAQSIVDSELRIHLNHLLDDYNKHLSYEIESLRYQWFEILESESRFENETLINFAKRNINGNFVTKIYQYLRGPETEMEKVHYNRGLLDIMSKALGKSSSDNYCSLSLSTSPYQTILNYFNEATSMQIYAYFMTLHSYEIMRKYSTHEKNYSAEISSFIKNSKLQFENSARVMIRNVLKTHREIWKCNPERHIEGETFLEASKTFQAVVLQEGENCEIAEKIILPAGITEKKTIEVCEAGYTSFRRYDFISVATSSIFFEEKKTYGRGGFCSFHLYHEETMKNQISVCFNKDSLAHRYFDLQPVLADVEDNKVVTGVRFTKKNKVFQLQIQQGELSERGQIKQSTVAWKHDSETRQTSDNEAGFHGIYKLEKEKRKIEFANIATPANEVITGVAFIERDGVLKLNVQTNPIDFETGKVLKTPKWYSHGSTAEAEFKLINPNIPTSSSFRSAPVSKPYQFIKFTHSDFHLDASQSTVPFLDAQPVTSKPIAVPLQGIDLFLKGETGSGGFLTLSIKTFDYIKHYQINSKS